LPGRDRSGYADDVVGLDRRPAAGNQEHDVPNAHDADRAGSALRALVEPNGERLVAEVGDRHVHGPSRQVRDAQ